MAASRREREEFMHWLLTSKRTRRVEGLPSSQKEYAEWKGRAAKTLTRWKQDPEFQAALVAEETARARESLGGAVSSTRRVDGRVGGVEGPKDARLAGRKAYVPLDGSEPAGPVDLVETHARVLELLAAEVEEGNVRAAELWFKTLGKPFVDAEQAGAGPLDGLSDVELAEVTTDLLDDAGFDALVSRRAAG